MRRTTGVRVAAAFTMAWLAIGLAPAVAEAEEGQAPPAVAQVDPPADPPAHPPADPPADPDAPPFDDPVVEEPPTPPPVDPPVAEPPAEEPPAEEPPVEEPPVEEPPVEPPLEECPLDIPDWDPGEPCMLLGEPPLAEDLVPDETDGPAAEPAPEDDPAPVAAPAAQAPPQARVAGPVAGPTPPVVVPDVPVVQVEPVASRSDAPPVVTDDATVPTGLSVAIGVGVLLCAAAGGLAVRRVSHRG